jgi:hypothetical protein
MSERLYVKGERRYAEAADADVMQASAEIYFRLGMNDDGLRADSHAAMLRAWEKRAVLNEAMCAVKKGED